MCVAAILSSCNLICHIGAKIIKLNEWRGDKVTSCSHDFSHSIDIRDSIIYQYYAKNRGNKMSLVTQDYKLY